LLQDPGLAVHPPMLYMGYVGFSVPFAFAIAAILLIWFVRYELRQAFPELDPRLFKSAPFTSGMLAITIAFLALMGLVYELTLYLQTVRDYSPLKAGMALVPFAVALLIVAPLAPKIAERRGDRRTVMAGMAVLAAGLLIFLATSTDSSYLVVFAGLLFAGAGVSLIQPPASAPGFHLVEVRNPFGTAAGMLELSPTVSGGRIGNLMNVRVDNGSVGTCTLLYSTELLDVPDTLPDVGYARLVDLDALLSGGVFTVTIFTDQPITVSKFKIPKDVAIAGIPFYIQALCEQGFPSEGPTTVGFTNVGTVPGRPGVGNQE